MCTAITMQTKQHHILFGRTMDFSYSLEPEFFYVPRGYGWSTAVDSQRHENRYSFLGVGQGISPVIFADGVNERGFAVAALYFPGYAQYDSASGRNSEKLPVAATELVHFLLGTCASVNEAAAMLPTVRIMGVKDPVTNSVAPLHWILADRSGCCMVAEKTADGLHLMDNAVGVLANSPDFTWQVTNLRNYMNVSPGQQQERNWGSVNLSPFGQGAGTFGLPGDYTPPSRFVRAAFQKSHANLPRELEGAVVACFHIMESVSIPKGVVMTARGTSDYTQYTAFMDLETQRYYFKTYDNSQITTVQLPSSHAGGREMVSLGKLVRPIAFAHLMG